MTALQNTQYWSSDFFKCAKELVAYYSREAEKKSVVNQIARVYDTSERQEIFISEEDQTVVDFVPEGATVPLNDYSKGYRTSFEPQKVAKRIEITMEMLWKSRDNTEKILETIDYQTRSLVSQTYNQIEKRIHDYYNNGFVNTFAVSPDAEPLFSATHTFATGQAFDNLLAATAPSVAVFDEVEKRAGAFVWPNGMPMTFGVNTIICKKGGSASREFLKILGYNSGQYHPTTVGAVNIYEGMSYKVIETPFITSDTAYFFTSDFMDIGQNVRNPIICGFTTRPDVNEDFSRDPRNGNKFTMVTACYKDGISYLPVGMYGSQG